MFYNNIYNYYTLHDFIAWRRKGMSEEPTKTSIQISTELRDRLYRLKFRKTYEEFLDELCDLYEDKMGTRNS